MSVDQIDALKQQAIASGNPATLKAVATALQEAAGIVACANGQHSWWLVDAVGFDPAIQQAAARRLGVEAGVSYCSRCKTRKHD